jgi:hypothetical protein
MLGFGESRGSLGSLVWCTDIFQGFVRRLIRMTIMFTHSMVAEALDVDRSELDIRWIVPGSW